MINNRLCFILIIIALVSTAAQAVCADVVVLTSGERFTSPKVWQENDKLYFDLQGLVVSVNMTDIATVIRDNDDTAGQPEPPVPPSAARQMQPPPAAVQAPDTKPESAQASKIADQKPTPDKQKARGIGLDGLAWRMKPSEINGITRLDTDPSYGGVDQYGWPAGNLTLGDVILDGLVFRFWRNQLYSIMVWVDGHPGYLRLRQAVFDRYGAGLKNKSGLERYVWPDDTTTDRMLEFDPKLNTGIFWMRSRDLDRRIKSLYPEG